MFSNQVLKNSCEDIKNKVEKAIKDEAVKLLNEMEIKEHGNEYEPADPWGDFQPFKDEELFIVFAWNEKSHESHRPHSSDEYYRYNNYLFSNGYVCRWKENHHSVEYCKRKNCMDTSHHSGYNQHNQNVKFCCLSVNFKNNNYIVTRKHIYDFVNIYLNVKNPAYNENINNYFDNEKKLIFESTFNLNQQSKQNDTIFLRVEFLFSSIVPLELQKMSHVHELREIKNTLNSVKKMENSYKNRETDLILSVENEKEKLKEDYENKKIKLEKETEEIRLNLLNEIKIEKEKMISQTNDEIQDMIKNNIVKMEQDRSTEIVKRDVEFRNHLKNLNEKCKFGYDKIVKIIFLEFIKQIHYDLECEKYISKKDSSGHEYIIVQKSKQLFYLIHSTNIIASTPFEAYYKYNKNKEKERNEEEQNLWTKFEELYCLPEDFYNNLSMRSTIIILTFFNEILEFLITSPLRLYNYDTDDECLEELTEEFMNFFNEKLDQVKQLDCI